MAQQDDQVPYQQLIEHFDRPAKSPLEHFDPDELPEGEPRELYDTIMAEYYTHIPVYRATSAKEKTKFDLVTRTLENRDKLAAKAQSINSETPEVLETTETKQMTRQDVKTILGSYKQLRPAKRTSTHP